MNVLDSVTLRTLTKNRTRTLVTIIGIILSAAMITAVTTFVSSLRQTMLDTVVAQTGDWHGVVFNVQDFGDRPEVAAKYSLHTVGFTKLDSSANEYKPYIFLGAADGEFFEKMPVRLTAGRLPESGSEVILPSHLSSNGGVRYALGDTVNLGAGVRSLDGEELSRQTELCEGEEYAAGAAKEYTVVGFYKRPSFEYYSSAGYTALTLAQSGEEYPSEDVYFRLKNIKSVYSFIEDNFHDARSTINSDYLRFSGASSDVSFNSVLYGLATILIGIIMVGSVSLIYNAFSISVSERTVQFGILSSVGATRRQLMKSVLFEAFSLSLIGIPLGILSGIAGIGVTLKAIGSSFAAISNGQGMNFSVSWLAVAAAAGVGLVTVFISALIPAVRATRVSAVEALRRSGDIRIRPRGVKTSPLTMKLFGFEGALAAKNFKRSRKKYRATVLSLFISIVLFISAGSFCSYLTRGARSVVSYYDYDVAVMADGMTDGERDSLWSEITSLGGIKRSSRLLAATSQALLPGSSLSQDFRDMCGEDDCDTSLTFIFPDDGEYARYVKDNGLSGSGGILYDFMRVYSTDGRYHICNVLADASGSITLHDGRTVSFAERSAELPFGMGMGQSMAAIIYPRSMAEELLSADEAAQADELFAFSTDDPAALAAEAEKLLAQRGLPTDNVVNTRENAAVSRALVTIVNVFSYGFIVLISLIAAANVFNTISTNISLRRREFAMLRSVGMDGRGFARMMRYECLLYGLKGLALGLPVSIGVTWLIYRSVTEGLEMSFYIPVDILLIAVLSVFAVVGATMLYSVSLLKKENTVDTLKNENI